MKLNVAEKSTVTMTVFAVVLATQLVAAAPTSQVAQLPNPILIFVGQELKTIGGKQIMRYQFDVFNKEVYPANFFAASPKLPPCGNNTSASRTWVDVYDQNGKRLNGFCSLGKPEDLNGIWFALEPDVIPPSWVYIELNDRQTNTKYKSNLAETAL